MAYASCLLPAKIKKGEDTYTFEYNNKNQLVSITLDEKEPLVSIKETFIYNTDGTIASYKRSYYGAKKEYTYNNEKGTVTSNNHDQYTIDKNGLMQNKVFEDNGKKFTITYDYDKFYNFLKFHQTVADAPSGVVFHQQILTYTYDNALFSPYVNVGLPSWFMFGEYSAWEVLPVALATGTHMPKTYLSVDINTEDGKSTEKEDEKYTVAVSKSQDGYPTELTVDGVRYYEGKEEVTYKNTYAIEYKTMEEAK